MKATPPILSVPFSMRAANDVIQGAGRAASAPAGNGQGRRSVGSRSASSRASTRPASSGANATRSRIALTVKEPLSGPDTSPMPTRAAVSTGSGSRDRLIGPSMTTGRPSAEDASSSKEAL